MPYFSFIQMLTVFHSIHFQTTTFSDTTKSHHNGPNNYGHRERKREREREREREELNTAGLARKRLPNEGLSRPATATVVFH
jgi:hypothetical protein